MSEPEQPSLIVNTPTGEKPNPKVVTLVMTEAINAQVKAQSDGLSASMAETAEIESRAKARETQHSPSSD